MSPRLGILAAMDRELDTVLADLRDRRAERVLGRTFHAGSLHGADAVAVISGIGKTAVATTTTLLIERFAAHAIVLIGVAGRVSDALAVGDVVIASELVHHDLDARPIFPRYEVPALRTARLPTDARLAERAAAAAMRFAAGRGTVARGLVLSGDQFLGEERIAELRGRFPDGLAVEMEGAAVAQVCIESGTPCAVVRTISDGGDAASFRRFLERDAGEYARGILAALVPTLA